MKRYKVTCPVCRQYGEADKGGDAILAIQHTKNDNVRCDFYNRIPIQYIDVEDRAFTGGWKDESSG